MTILPSLIPNPFRGGLLPRIAAWWRRRRCAHGSYVVWRDMDGLLIAQCELCGECRKEVRRG